MANVKEAVVEPILYPRDLVFAAACATQRINGAYVKPTDHARFVNHIYGHARPNAISTAVEVNATKLYNSAIMKTILASDRSDILPQDYIRAEEVIAHFCSMITLVFSGEARDFIKDAVEASIAKEIPNAGKVFGLVASLPAIYERNISRTNEREKLEASISQSVPLSQSIESPIRANVTVIDSVFKWKYGSSAVNVTVNNVLEHHVLFFFDKQSWVKGHTYNIAARIKNKQEKITQLYRVRQLEPGGKEREI